MAGQIVSRGKSTWLVRVFLGRDTQSGKRRYLNHTVHGTKHDAQAYLTEALRDRDLGPAVQGRVSVGDLLEALLLDYQVNGKSYDWAELIVRVHLRPFFGSMLAGKVSTATAQQYIRHRQTEGARNGTINRDLAILARALNLARMAGKLARVPYVAKLQENNVRKGFFEHDEFLTMRAALPEEIRPVLMFGYYTGCRKGEILSLQWPQVDLSERAVRLEPGTTKNDEARILPLAEELYQVLSMQRAIRDAKHPGCPWVFSRDGERILDFRRVWESASKAAGLWEGDAKAGKPTKLFHDLRRTGVRNLVRAGVPEAVAMRISGHKTRAVFDRYNIVSERDLKDAARRLGEYLSEKDAESRHTIGTQAILTPDTSPQENQPKLLN